MNIIFEILFSTRENDIHTFKLPCNVILFLNSQKSEQAKCEHINPAGKFTRLSPITLVKIWKILVF